MQCLRNPTPPTTNSKKAFFVFCVYVFWYVNHSLGRGTTWHIHSLPGSSGTGLFSDLGRCSVNRRAVPLQHSMRWVSTGPVGSQRCFSFMHTKTLGSPGFPLVPSEWYKRILLDLSVLLMDTVRTIRPSLNHGLIGYSGIRWQRAWSTTEGSKEDTSPAPAMLPHSSEGNRVDNPKQERANHIPHLQDSLVATLCRDMTRTLALFANKNSVRRQSAPWSPKRTQQS